MSWLPELFVAALAGLLLPVLLWGFRHLPEEHWQILATVPLGRDANGDWRGLNLTYYGLLSSSAQLFSVLVCFLLLGAVGVGRLQTVMLVLAILGPCLPAARLVARLVEGKQATLTVGGAAFVGVVLAPWALVAYNALLGVRLGAVLPVLPALAALAVAYAYGEGLGRLACISFGCCYGKPLAQSPRLAQRLFSRFHFVFRGHTKKIAYASNLDGHKVLPIQAVTAMIYTVTALLATALFLHAAYSAALLLALGVTQLWRAFSELLRADYRGGGRISVYQGLAVLAVVYASAVYPLLGSVAVPTADLLSGFETLWHPGLLLFVLSLWMGTFFYYGRSAVTGARVSLYVCRDRV